MISKYASLLGMPMLLVFFFFSTNSSLYAQDDLLAELESQNQDTITKFLPPAFKAFKIANLQSTKVASKKEFYMYLSHRFGDVSKGISTFFGLDEANTKIELIYGLFEDVQFGISRESYRQTYGLTAKAILARPTKKFPIQLTGFTAVNMYSDLDNEQFPHLDFDHQFAYVTQVLASYRFNDGFSVLFTPTYFRQNAVLEIEQDHNQFALGMGGRYKLSKRLSVNFDYVWHLNRYSNSRYYNPISLGLDIDTGGHIFQLLFTNAQSANETAFMSNAEADILSGELYFGFNLIRVF